MESSDTEEVDPPQLSLVRMPVDPPDSKPALSYWGSLKYTAKWYTDKLLQRLNNVQKAVVEPYEVYDSIVRQILTSKILLPEDRAFVESVLNSETSFACLNESRKWPETYRIHCLVSSLAVFVVLLCLKRNTKFELVALSAALFVTVAKYLTVSQLKCSIFDLGSTQATQAAIIKWAMVQIKDDESFNSQQGASTSKTVDSPALLEIETMGRQDSELFARNVFETIQAECLLWETVSRDIRTAIIQHDRKLILPANLEDCATSCPRLFQSQDIAESTDNFSFSAVKSIKTLSDLQQSECLRNICLALVQRCQLGMRSVYMFKASLDTVVALQLDNVDFLYRQHCELKAKQSSLFSRLQNQYNSGNGKSKYADCDLSVRVLCTNLERCLQLATAVHYEIQEGQDTGVTPSFGRMNELIDLLTGNLTQSVSFAADFQLRINTRRQRRASPAKLEDSMQQSQFEEIERVNIVDLESLPSGPSHDEIYLGKVERRKSSGEGGGDGRTQEDREPSGALAPPVMSQLKDVLKAKEAERITREAAAMKRLGLEEPQSSSDDDDDDQSRRPGTAESSLTSGGGQYHTGFSMILAQAAAQKAKLSGGGGEDYVLSLIHI